MDSHRYKRDENTGKIELERLLECVLKNGYTFEGTREAIVGREHHENHMIADFEKALSFSDINGNWEYGSMKVMIQFEKSSDYKNMVNNDDGDMEYVGDSNEFIENLIVVANKKLSKHRRTRKRRSSKSRTGFEPASI